MTQRNAQIIEHCAITTLIPHPSKILLRIILNRLIPQAEQILAEEQAGFRKSRSTIEQIINSRIIMEKHIEIEKNVYHNYIDFKKAFDRVWHNGLWSVMGHFGISHEIIRIIESLYENSKCAIILNNKTGDFFHTTVKTGLSVISSVIQYFLRTNHAGNKSTISVGGRIINNLRFADDIDLIAGTNSELQELTNRLSEASKD